LLGIAAVALGCVGALASLGSHAVAWLGVTLRQAFTGVAPSLPAPSLPAVTLLVVLVCLGAVTLIAQGRRRSRNQLGVHTDLVEVRSWVTLGLCVTALALALIWLRPALAGAARSVDAAGVSGLWLVWSRWLGRGLLTLALVAASVGVLERLASARRLWQGLHLTRAQARERARASGARSRPR
jgi:hypothetical protein